MQSNKAPQARQRELTGLLQGHGYYVEVWCALEGLGVHTRRSRCFTVVWGANA